MKIDKLINNKICIDDWGIKRIYNMTATNIDELAYYLYISENEDPDWNLYGFMTRINEVAYYYSKAKLIMRKEKLEKIKKLNNVQH